MPRGGNFDSREMAPDDDARPVATQGLALARHHRRLCLRKSHQSSRTTRIDLQPNLISRVELTHSSDRVRGLLLPGATSDDRSEDHQQDDGRNNDGSDPRLVGNVAAKHHASYGYEGEQHDE
jgi:hypothetical protein